MTDIVTIQGDTRIVAIPIFDVDTQSFATLADVADVEYVVATEPSPDAVLERYTLADPNIQILDRQDINTVQLDEVEGLSPTDTVIEVRIPPEDAQNFAAETLWHECQVTDIAGDVTTVMRGDFQVQPSATNP